MRKTAKYAHRNPKHHCRILTFIISWVCNHVGADIPAKIVQNIFSRRRYNISRLNRNSCDIKLASNDHIILRRKVFVQIVKIALSLCEALYKQLTPGSRLK